MGLGEARPLELTQRYPKAMKPSIFVFAALWFAFSMFADSVTLTELLSEPEKYNGRKVSVVGFYYMKSPSSVLYPDKKAFKKSNTENAVWIGADSEDANPSKVVRKNKKTIKVIGIFRGGGFGIFDQYAGKIDEIISMEIVSNEDY